MLPTETTNTILSDISGVPAYDAVLFDNDGILVQPPGSETQAAATRTAFEAVGVDDPEPEHVDAIGSGLTVEELRELCAAYDVDPEAFWDARERHDEESQLDAFRAGERDCYDDVAAIEELSVPCGVVTNNHHTTIEFVLEYFDLDAWCETFHGRPKTIESLARKKPDPHFLELACEAIGDGVGAESVLYVGDSESDVVGAHRAGMDSAFVRRSHCRDVECSEAPTYEISSLRELPAIVEGQRPASD